LREIIESQQKTRFERAHFKSFEESALYFEVVYHVLDPDYAFYMDVQQRINLSICEKFDAEGIDFAYPTRTIFMNRAAEG
jgi:small-conductance mechanosensitive channel